MFCNIKNAFTVTFDFLKSLLLMLLMDFNSFWLLIGFRFLNFILTFLTITHAFYLNSDFIGGARECAGALPLDTSRRWYTGYRWPLT